MTTNKDSTSVKEQKKFHSLHSYFDDQKTARLQAHMCMNCGATPAELDEPLKNCVACHRVSYCSKECQREHWKAHKPTCQSFVDGDAQLKIPLEKGDKPPHIIWERLAKSFMDVYTSETEQAFFWAMESEGGNNFDFSAKYIKVKLHPRLTSGANPSMLFTIERAEFALYKDVLPGSHEAKGLEMVRPSAIANEGMYKKSMPGYIGLLLVYWETPGCGLWSLSPRMRLRPPLDEEEAEFRTLNCRDWCKRFKFMVEKGFIMRQVPPEKKAMPHAIGKLKQEKGNNTGKWVWKEVPDDMLKRMGCSDAFIESAFMHFWYVRRPLSRRIHLIDGHLEE